ncbi:hypothetical protein IE81DRAFT_324693 [Ceraceosorus guamensis]|uniref:Nuclear pore complex protein Nup85 n=1 Tax=Ceraceosorus guamensis TaxID=1522189 RepID=A0A316VY36_9BASI|nr:hypothetical protein IE81DRAFT_324693 [Ceraceosorus guamensis]PWN41303.1 hypothetical protein IE81DRAFT_324693 [Ceraceosorus guamensis]
MSNFASTSSRSQLPPKQVEMLEPLAWKPEPLRDTLLRGMFAGDWADEDTVNFLVSSYIVFSNLKQIIQPQSSARDEAFSSRSSFLGAASHSRQTVSITAETISRLSRVSTNLYSRDLTTFQRRLGSRLEELSELTSSNATSNETRKELKAELEGLRRRASCCAEARQILSLATTMYLPQDGEGMGIVGEELLNWVNIIDPAPSTEEGRLVISSAVPYEHAQYWDYLLRLTIRGFNKSAATLLRSLSTHQSSTIARLSVEVAELFDTLPRSTSFGTERQFVNTRRSWVLGVRALLSRLEKDMDRAELELAGGADEAEGEASGGSGRFDASKKRASFSSEEAEDARLEYEAQFRCLLEIVAGVAGRTFEACQDWKEALGAWGVYVLPTMRRENVPETMRQILKELPIDQASDGESLLSLIAGGETSQLVQKLLQYDAWLAVHLIDLLDKAGIADDETARGIAIEQYAETLLDDSGLWRLSVDYLGCILSAEQSLPLSATERIRVRMRDIILSVPLDESKSSSTTTDAIYNSRLSLKTLAELEGERAQEEMDEDSDDPDAAKERRAQRAKEESEKRGNAFAREVEQVLGACVAHRLEGEARAVCKRVAKHKAASGQYGLAIAYCVRAGDARQVRRIADAILEEYVIRGADVFCKLVDDIPRSLLDGLPTSKSNEKVDAQDENVELNEEYGSGRSLISGRLAFLARYRDFHHLYAERRLREAAELLVLLLTSNVAPERFWAVLIIDAIPLLESEENLFTTEETFDLLRVVEQILSSISGPGASADTQHFLGYVERLLSPAESVTETAALRRDLADIDVDAAKQRLDVARFGLARQLARNCGAGGPLL